jgi:TolB-like protein
MQVLAAAALMVPLAIGAYLGATKLPIVPIVQPVFIGVSIFDNETGLAEYDRLVAGLSDLVVERLSKLDAERLAIIGNSFTLRQPRNIRNLKNLKGSPRLDYVILGQLQKGEDGLRFITHFIRLSDEAHLKANRLTMPRGGVDGLEKEVVEEFERAVRDHVLNRPSN